MTHKNLDFDPELEHKVKRVTERFSENLHIIANEPSLAFYRLQEHVHKSLPHLVEKKIEINRVHENVQGSCYDTEYAINAVNTMHASSRHLENVQTLLKNAMFLKQQINYEALRKKGQQKSMYTKTQDEAKAQATRFKSAPKDGTGTPKHQPSSSGK